MVTVARERAISNSEKLQLGRNWESADHASEQAKLLQATMPSPEPSWTG
jgi:hypothetical protein